jgi:hypothetical protein
MIFDLVRNGQAHQYQQITARLDDDRALVIGLTGAQRGVFLKDALVAGRPAEHLKCSFPDDHSVALYVRTDVLWLDLRESAHAARVFEAAANFKYLDREYAFTAAQLRDALMRSPRGRDRNEGPD